MEEKTRLWNKTVNEMTVGDQFKIAGASLAVGTVITVVYAVGLTLYEKRAERKAQKRLEAKNDKKK